MTTRAPRLVRPAALSDAEDDKKYLLRLVSDIFTSSRGSNYSTRLSLRYAIAEQMLLLACVHPQDGTTILGVDITNNIVSAYTSFINVLDYTTNVIPITFADKKIDIVPTDLVSLTDKDRLNMKSCTSYLTGFRDRC